MYLFIYYSEEVYKIFNYYRGLTKQENNLLGIFAKTYISS
jgi:hypothetical protein